jgi:S1-C subfamily serine protease
MHLRALALFILSISAAASVAHAQQPAQVLVKISAGTGFFINRDGDIVTNSHVVRDCKSMSVHTVQGERPVTLRARDIEHDLAVLRMQGQVPEVAPLRWNIRDVKVGDEVIVMGYPGQAGVSNTYVFRKTRILGLTGPTGEPNWLQLGNVAERGNSGGPVLDTTGNVIAVITGKAKTYRVESGNSDARESPTLIGETDVAITLAALQDFLRRNSIPFYEASSGLVAYADTQLEIKANQFIVPVRCIQSGGK